MWGERIDEIRPKIAADLRTALGRLRPGRRLGGRPRLDLGDHGTKPGLTPN